MKYIFQRKREWKGQQKKDRWAEVFRLCKKYERRKRFDKAAKDSRAGLTEADSQAMTTLKRLRSQTRSRDNNCGFIRRLLFVSAWHRFGRQNRDPTGCYITVQSIGKAKHKYKIKEMFHGLSLGSSPHIWHLKFVLPLWWPKCRTSNNPTTWIYIILRQSAEWWTYIHIWISG